MLKRCVFNILGVSPEFCDGNICTAMNNNEIRKCCGEAGSTVAPQDLMQTYLEAKESIYPIGGVFVALLDTIHQVEEKSGIRLL